LANTGFTRTLRALLLGLAVAQMAAGGTGMARPATTATAQSARPKNLNVLLFMSQKERDGALRSMETLAPVHRVRRGQRVRPLPAGRPLPALAWTEAGQSRTLESYIADEHVAGLLVLQDGRVRLERYALGFRPRDLWTSFSVAKSVTSTLVGAAVKDGFITSLDDPITRYLPELAGSAYESVTIRHVLTMTSGVKWNEDYSDPHSDVANAGAATVITPGVDPTLAYLAKLPREAEPGTKWVYKTGETNLIGVLLTHATKKSLAAYLSEKVWKPYGMGRDALWVVDANGQETGGCCLSATLRDFGRIGQFILEGGHGALPLDWLAAATRKQAETGLPGRGYGYQWWTEDDGTFDAFGIFGQLIHVDPKRRLVVVVNADWDKPVGASHAAARLALLRAIKAAADASPP
jgi:hypothetical protein